MGTLLLNSLEIRNFRGFHHLQIDHLGRVNLIVGKNNVGKSSLLEALQLYACRAFPTLIWEILGARDESSQSLLSRQAAVHRSAEIEERLLALKYLFYGRRDVKTYREFIKIGPLNNLDHTLTLSIGWYVDLRDEEGNLRRRLLKPEEYNTFDNPVPRFTIQLGRQPDFNYPLTVGPSRFLGGSDLDEIKYIFTTANGLDKSQVGNLWDNISLTSLEKDVLGSLRLIAPGVERLSFIGNPVSTREREQERIPIVKIAGIDEPIPLRSLGDGMQRILGIALALVNTTDGILLIDEIENGIHYSVQPELWQLIFQLARRLNVQIFATTHSWDCIEGFQKAAQEDKQEDGMLIRLSLKKDEVVATLFDERKLGIATREQIEVR